MTQQSQGATPAPENNGGKKKEEVTVKDHFESWDKFMSSIRVKFIQLADEETLIREIGFTKQLFDSNPSLSKTRPDTIRDAVMNVALTGLTLNPALKQAYLIPYGNICQFMPSYLGLMELAIQERVIVSMTSKIVHKNDLFEYEEGLNPILKHSPAPLDQEPGEMVGAYAIAVTPDGQKHIEVLRMSDIDKIKECTKGDLNRPTHVWNRWPGEMARKSAAKRLLKWLPSSVAGTVSTPKLSAAIHADNQMSRATWGQINLIESLMFQASISPERANEIDQRLHPDSMMYDEANMIIQELKESIPPGNDEHMASIRREIEGK